MHHGSTLLDDDVLSIGMMLKATPSTEGDQRFVYLEASREARDQQGEVVLAKALEESADHYIKFGNIDIDHKSMAPVAKLHGITEPHLWEIGTPCSVRIDGVSTFVKAQLLSGDTPLAAKANMVWESMTRLNPPRKWYPSVGGKVLAKSVALDPETGNRVEMVESVRWTNIALSQHPVNQHVDGVKTIPFGVLAKCWGPTGLNMRKALEASYETDASAKTGGAALGMQSLDTGRRVNRAPHSYFDFRDRLAHALMAGSVDSQNAEGLTQYAVMHLSLSQDEASEWVDRFIGDLRSKRSKPLIH